MFQAHLLLMLYAGSIKGTQMTGWMRQTDLVAKLTDMTNDLTIIVTGYIFFHHGGSLMTIYKMLSLNCTCRFSTVSSSLLLKAAGENEGNGYFQVSL